MRWRVLTLRLLDCFTDDRLKFEQLHLRLRKFFSARTILLDPHQPQPLFQYPNPQLRVATAELPHGYVAWALATLFSRSSGHYNTDPACRTGVLVRRLQT